MASFDRVKTFFFKGLTSTTSKVEDIEILERDIPIIIFKLYRIFPPGFFDSMEHLPIHLPNEAKIAGPVQYRLMYPFERLKVQYFSTFYNLVNNLEKNYT